MHTHKTAVICISLIALLCTASDCLRADISLPSIVDSHMVLQRDTTIGIWGWADPGEAVSVKLGAQEAATRASAQGEWRVELPAMEGGGPFEMTVRGNNTLKLTDILVGEVWICSGQSNMEMGIGAADKGAEEMAAANYPRIRLFELPRTPAGEPRQDVPARWRVCSPESIGDGSWGGFSATGYFFGRMLHRELDLPVGLIDSCWGGTRIAPWIPPCGFAAVPAVAHYVEEVRKKDRDFKQELPARLAKIETWITQTRKALDEKERLPLSPWWPRHPLESSGEPTGLYNGMIHPLTPFAIRGAIWYQGESNVHERDGMLYFEKMKALIHGWREVWGQGEFPFYYVQIAPFMYHWHKPDLEPFQMPLIWEAQTAALAIPNTGMVVTTDIGNLRDIHPANKQEVGKRLARWALARTYGRSEMVYSGPLYRSMKIEESRIRLFFDHTGSGLTARKGGPLDWFEIAEENREFLKAQAVIEENTVVVWHEEVNAPIAVRFGWHQEAEPNLMNQEGLPASPFRTDRWGY